MPTMSDGLMAHAFYNGVSSIDPIVFIGTPLVLASAAMVASYIPARRATRWSRWPH
jgi:hypothetical protein